MTRFVPTRILRIDLSDGAPALSPDPRYGRYYVCFWWRQTPLGHREFLASQLPLTSAELANEAVKAIAPAIGSHLLGRGFAAPMPRLSGGREEAPDLPALLGLSQPLRRLDEKMRESLNQPLPGTVSVVVCTRDRPDDLERCLRSLSALSRAPHEILVVDNAPRTEATRQLVARTPGVRYVCEPRPGLDIARNTGIRQSTGQIIAFTDDDAAVHADWLARIAEPFRDSRVMAAAGLVLPAELETEAHLIFEKSFGGFNKGFRPKLFDKDYFERVRHKGAPVWEIGAGANMAIRREAFELLGPFDERLDAGAAGCSGDSEFWYRVLAEGWSCAYTPAAVVSHYHRRDMETLRRQMYLYMRGHAAAALVQFERYRHWGNLRHLLVAVPYHYARLLVAGGLRGFPVENRMLLTGFLGTVAGVKFYLSHRPRRKKKSLSESRLVTGRATSTEGCPPTR